MTTPITTEQALKLCQKALTEISNLRWGWDGDCGATSIADNALEATAHNKVAPAVPDGAKDATDLDVVLFEIQQERERQDKIWGGPTHDDHHTLDQFLFFIGKRIKRLRGVGFDDRKELIKVAALAVATVEMLDRAAAPGAEK